MYDLEPWKRPTGIVENVVGTPPRPDEREVPGAPARDTDRVSLEIHRLEATYHRLKVDAAHCPGNAWQYNPSLCVHRGQLLASVRLYLDGNRRENVIGEVADDWTLTNQRVLRSTALEPPFKWLPGFEDLRLYVGPDGRLHAVAAVCARTHDGRFRAVMAILDLDDAATTIQAAHYQTSRYAEKNWMPLVERDGVVRFVYQTDPHTVVLRWDDEAKRVTPEPPGAAGMMRGSSQLLPLPDGRYLACVHENRAPAGHSVGRYVHRFVLFDRFLQLERKSEMFVFKETGIEFCGGMALWRGRLVLSFGLQDKEAWIAVMDLADALKAVGVEAQLPPADRPTQPEPLDDEDSGAYVRPRTEETMQSDLEPQLKPRPVYPGRLPEGAPPQTAPAATPVAVAPTDPAPPPPVQAGPTDEAIFTTVIPSLLGWCSEAKARRLADLVEHRHARTVVEIGVFGGRSLLALGVGARRVGATVIGIDPYTTAASLQGKNSPDNDKWWSGVDYEDVYKRASDVARLIPGMRLLRAASLQVAGACDPATVDMIHIDGNHSEETSCADVRAWLPKLSLGAIVVMDDVGWETTRKAQAMLTEAGCQLLEKHEPGGGESWAVYQCIGATLRG